MDFILVLIGAILFAGTHIGISSSGLRTQWQARLGQGPYLGIYSLISFVTIGFLIWAYARAVHGPAIWPTQDWAPRAVMPIALFFIVGGFTVPNPTSVGAEAKIGADAARGLLRITRHPVMWGFTLWAATHFIANGDLPSLVFFAAFAVVAVVGMRAIDKRKSTTAAWPQFAAVTSLVPFAAIAAGRNRLAPGEWILPAVLAIVLYFVLLWAHPYVSGGTVIA